MGRKKRASEWPEAVHKRLETLLSNRALTIKQITAELNVCLAEIGQADVGESTVGRYSQAFSVLRKRSDESKLVVNEWVNRLGEVPDGDYGRVMVEILRMLSVDLSAAISGEDLGKDLPGSVRMVKDLAMTVERIEKSASENQKREVRVRQEERQKTLEEASLAVSEAATARGLDADFARFLRESVLQGGV